MTEITIEGLPAYQLKPHTLNQINRLIAQLSPNAEALTLITLRTILLNNFLLVARDAKKDIVGMTTLILCHKPTGRVGLIEDVIVDRVYRGRGIGRMLMCRAIETARACGIKHMDLTSHPRRTEARALYRSLGFDERKTTCFRLKL